MDKPSKKYLKELADLRHTAHLMGPLEGIRDILERAGKVYGDRPAFVEKIKDEIITHTAAQFHDDVYAFGTAMLELGLKDKHIAVIGENSYGWVVSFFAITCGVGVAVPIDKELPDEDISMLLTKADVDAVCCSRTYVNTVKFHMSKDERAKYCFVINRAVEAENFFFLEDMIKKGKELIASGDRRYLDAKVDNDATSAIVFTSGTTGANKGVMLSGKNFAANVDGIIDNIKQEASSISLLPMNHTYELSCNIMTSIYMNAIIYVNDSIRNFMANVTIFKPEAMAIVPLVIDTIYSTIWSTAEKSGKAEALKKLIAFSNKLMAHGIDLRSVLFSTIRKKFGYKFPTFSCGGAPTRTEYLKCLGDIGFNVYMGYGLTECSPSVALNMDARGKPASAGHPFPKTQITISEKDADGVGEIWVKGDNVTKGYYKDDEATAASFEDGWFKTGDYGKIGEDGELYVVGRKKNLIILDNGKNIYPEEIETFFMENTTFVRETVAFQIDVDILGKTQTILALAAYACPDDYPGKSEAEIISEVEAEILAANKKLPGYKKIQEVMVSTTEYEKTSTLKIIRKKVEDAFVEYHNKKQGEMNHA